MCNIQLITESINEFKEHTTFYKKTKLDLLQQTYYSVEKCLYYEGLRWKM